MLNNNLNKKENKNKIVNKNSSSLNYLYKRYKTKFNYNNNIQNKIEIEVRTCIYTDVFTFGDTVITSATEEQADCFVSPASSDYSFRFVSTSTSFKVVMASEAGFALYVSGTGNDTTGNGSSSNPYATLEKALTVATERYALVEDDYTIIIKDEISLTKTVEIKDVPGITITGNVAEGSDETILINGTSKSITISCDAKISNLEFKSLQASSITNGPLTIASGVEVEEEYVKVTDCTNNKGNGGGIYNPGTLTLTNCTVSDYKAIYENSVPDSGRGGGIYSATGASLTLEDSTIKENNAKNGGGIYIAGTSLSFMSGFVSRNQVSSDEEGYICGGGIYIDSGTMEFGGGQQLTQYSFFNRNSWWLSRRWNLYN